MAKYSRSVALLAGIVYFTQGALGIISVTLPVYLRKLGWSVGEITEVLAISSFPWVLKILYGLLSDCFPLFSYRRKSYLLVFAVISFLGWLSLILLPTQKIFIICSLMLSNFGFAATDVVTDGYIVENSKGVSSHIYQSIAWGTRSFGAIVSGVTGGWLSAHWHPKDVFMAAGALPLIVVPVTLLLREPRYEHGLFHSVIAPFKLCLEKLTIGNIRWFLLLLLISQVSACFGTPFFFHMKEQMGFQETFLGTLISLGWMGALISSVVYAKWFIRFSPKTVLSWAFLINAANILSTVFIRERISALIFVFLGGVMACMTILPMMSVAAILTRRSGVEGTLFAVLMSVHNLAQIAFGFLGGKFYNLVGLYTLIYLSGVISLIGMWVVQKLDFKDAETWNSAREKDESPTV